MYQFLRHFFLAFLLICGGCGQTTPTGVSNSRTIRTAETRKIDRTSETKQKISHTRELDDSELPWGRPADWETQTPLAPGISY